MILNLGAGFLYDSVDHFVFYIYFATICHSFCLLSIFSFSLKNNLHKAKNLLELNSSNLFYYKIYYKNVYQGYLSSAEPRSLSEKRFEKFCEKNECVDWFYKNGDKGDEYFSIVYYDNSNNQKLFYPDYILSVNNLVWIIETKGGFTRSGESQDIDIFSPKKFELLKRYVDNNKINGGFVRYDEATDELYIARENYNEDINSSDWELLSDIF